MKLWSVVSACVAACILNAADDLRIDLLADAYSTPPTISASICWRSVISPAMPFPKG